MSPTPRRAANRRVAGAVVQFGSFILLLGIPDGLLGVLWPTMRRNLHRPLADLGELVVAGTALYVVGGLVGDRLQRAIGLRATLFWSTVVGLGALLGWALSPSWWAILLALGLLGLVKGILDVVLNALAAVDGGVRRLGFLHASWAVGGTLGPVLVATLVAGGDWRLAVGVVAAASAVLVPLAAASPPRPTHPTGARPLAEVPSPVPGVHSWWPGRRGLAAPPPWLALATTTFAFAAYTGAEAAAVSWATTYLVGDRHLGTTAAAAAMAVFWGALTLGRLGLAVPHQWHPARVLEASCLLFVAGMAMFWLLPGALAVVGLAVGGLGSATIFPLYVALTPGRLGEEVTGRALGYAIAGAATGGPIAVASFGVLASHFGTSVLAPCLFGATVVMYIGHRLLAAVSKSAGAT
ncbi:MAG: MFS transporter [Acidimicrobiales bacterium]